MKLSVCCFESRFSHRMHVVLVHRLLIHPKLGTKQASITIQLCSEGSMHASYAIRLVASERVWLFKCQIIISLNSAISNDANAPGRAGLFPNPSLNPNLPSTVAKAGRRVVPAGASLLLIIFRAGARHAKSQPHAIRLDFFAALFD